MLPLWEDEMERLAGKRALITGGARGIGAAIARAFAKEGARLAVADLLNAEAEALAAEIGKGAIAKVLDVSDLGQIGAVVAEVEAEFGGIDILVNNAGVFDMAPITEVTPEMYRRQFDVNVGGTVFTAQAVAKGMIERGTGGAILNLSSQAGRRGEKNVLLYCAAKASIVSITQSMALDLAEHGIRVNAIAPGVVDTPMWDVVDRNFAKYENRQIGEKKRLVGEAVPLGRMGYPEEVADPAVFLVSDEARYVTAQTVNVCGGNCLY